MLEIVAGEFRSLLKGRFSTLALLFGVPILYTLLFGFFYSANAIKHIPLVVYDQDQTATSRALVQAFADSERYNIVSQVSSQEEMEKILSSNSAMAALVVPEDFSRDIKLGRRGTALLETNATNLMFSNSVLSSSQEIFQTFAAGAGQKMIEGINQPPAQALKTVAPVRMGLRIVDNPAVSYSNFVMPGLSINGWQIAIFLVSCTLLTSEYAALARRKLPAWAIIFGKLLPYWLLSMLSYLITIFLLVAIFNLPFHGSLIQLLLIGGAFSFAMCAFGLFVSALNPHLIKVLQISALFVMSAFLCCGYSWPLFVMNSIGKIYASLLPMTYAAATVRDIMMSAYIPNLLRNCLTLFAFGGICCLLAMSFFSLRRKSFLNNAGGV